MKKRYFLSAVLIWALPATGLAADNFAIDAEVIPENVEAIMELVILALAVLSAIFAVKLAALSQGGSLEKTWNWLAGASLTFALLEIYGALQGFGLLHLGGVAEVIELVLALILFKVFYSTRKELLKKVLGK